ncbi:winged helix-turn-helix domain-containing protein (plasmid) [Streptomyces sp. Qhu-G9]|uniref:winged helix-turn-helix domain-containing protein n=1 Tax=Streptomyces sp. Qhu-G9 TaxID=3452799 RepID=UPI0022ABD43F|nr:winged helix-turn-helix domain-containing protein [Streptomyces aurantiacus]WAU78368.1 winged helix-turn-helix domain-containing protein [Streptomyces aurantiacus]
MSDGPSGGRGASQYVLTELRARLLAKAYPFNSNLPTQRDLAEDLGVSRATVQKALGQLVEEGWIESRQGSGSRVIRKAPAASATGGISRMRTAELGWFVEQALQQNEVQLDVYCLTSESLDIHLRLQAERILTGATQGPGKIKLRIMLPTEDLLLPFPRNDGDPGDARVVQRLRKISARCLSSVEDTLQNLRANGSVRDIGFRVKYVPVAPMFKSYLLNGRELFLSMYTVEKRRIPLGDEEVDALDVLSVGAAGTYFSKNDEADDAESAWVEKQQTWFNSHWEHT